MSNCHIASGIRVFQIYVVVESISYILAIYFNLLSSIPFPVFSILTKSKIKMILDLCEKYFATRNLYRIFDLERTASEKESEYSVCFNIMYIRFGSNNNLRICLYSTVRKAYRKKSLLVHPDTAGRAIENTTNTTEKFQILHKAYEVLTDPEKRKLYDARGIIAIHQSMSYIVTDAQFEECRQKYAGMVFCLLCFVSKFIFSSTCSGSGREKQDIQNAYITGSGRITYVMKHVPFLLPEDKPRVTGIINGNSISTPLSIKRFQ